MTTDPIIDVTPPKLCSKCPKVAGFLYKKQLLCSGCTSLVPADAPIISIRQQYKRTNKKSIDEIETTKNYSGEASPYWDHIAQRQRHDAEGGPVEAANANPDVLSEDDSIHDRPLTDNGVIALQAVQEVFPTLTDQQKSILEMCGFEGKTERVAADALNIKQQTLHVILVRIREKIQRRYDQLSAAGD